MSGSQKYDGGHLSVLISAAAIASRSNAKGLDTRHIEGIWLEGQSTSEAGLGENFILQVSESDDRWKQS